MSDNPIDGDPFSLQRALQPAQYAQGGETAQPKQPMDPNDFTGRYNTDLSPDAEQAFQRWIQKRSAEAGRDVSHDLYDYDLRGAWLNSDPHEIDPQMHMTDQFKKPNHPTFSDQSQYSSPETPGGHWTQLPDGKWNFAPSQFNMQMHGEEQLQRYWQHVEQGAGNTLTLPQTTAPLPGITSGAAPKPWGLHEPMRQPRQPDWIDGLARSRPIRSDTAPGEFSTPTWQLPRPDQQI